MTKASLRLTSQSTPLLVVAEPWAEEIHVPPASTPSLRFTSPDAPCDLELEYRGSQIRVYAWPGASFEYEVQSV